MTNTLNRRQLLRQGTVLIATVSLSNFVGASDLPMASESDPTALALGYKADATQVDTTQYPKRAGEQGATQFCSNCALYGGAPGSTSGPCPILPGKAVSAQGWCNVWAPKG